MRDLVLLVVVGLFFVLALAYLRGCEALLGADEEPPE